MQNPSPFDPDLEALVTASLVRWGSDTKAARVFKELRSSERTLPRPVATLSAALEPRSDRRGSDVALAVAQSQAALLRAVECGASVVASGRTGYPSRLEEIPDPPIVLWALGESALLDRPAVALVGSRRATPGGLAAARQLGRDLARAGLVVVSGLARGIDAAAHEGALEGGGATVAVLGCGVDVVYPREHRDLVRRVRLTGCLVSEMPPGTPPLPRHFPLRNRIISGLSLAVVVVEAAERSGSLITARLALEQGRDVLAVPGGVVSGCHRGCHALIKDGAGLVETVDDILAELGWRPAGTATAPKPEGLIGLMTAGEPLSLDELVARVARSPVELLAELGELEVAGQVARMPGGAFVRLD